MPTGVLHLNVCVFPSCRADDKDHNRHSLPAQQVELEHSPAYYETFGIMMGIWQSAYVRHERSHNQAYHF